MSTTRKAPLLPSPLERDQPLTLFFGGAFAAAFVVAAGDLRFLDAVSLMSLSVLKSSTSFSSSDSSARTSSS